ncbi:hypothetical protein SCLCIDRAFT_490065 [Scleroderma citrinum Foug A]|uniref:Uncharacterized protein n=1 Tax=Scleroderma citrinum Foug A TaxID=1036808 RepID=A0A0C3A870_9AGAM|nr:hypothetical protein SCLCIDRAFT_490065 [Scleroderma citrinum Foug A]
MSDVLAHHAPALKVGGRRLSVSNTAKPHATSTSPKTTTGSDNADYPRPAAQGDEQPEATPQKEEDAPKKEKKHGRGEKRPRENFNDKVEATRPTKDHMASKHGFGAAGRIAQPASKAFGI